jgi:hypothetical protein
MWSAATYRISEEFATYQRHAVNALYFSESIDNFWNLCLARDVVLKINRLTITETSATGLSVASLIPSFLEIPTNLCRRSIGDVIASTCSCNIIVVRAK